MEVSRSDDHLVPSPYISTQPPRHRPRKHHSAAAGRPWATRGGKDGNSAASAGYQASGAGLALGAFITASGALSGRYGSCSGDLSVGFVREPRARISPAEPPPARVCHPAGQLADRRMECCSSMDGNYGPSLARRPPPTAPRPPGSPGARASARLPRARSVRRCAAMQRRWLAQAARLAR